MRLFANIEEAIPEIRRDLAKSPAAPTSRVQHLELSGMEAREAMNYGYTILGEGIPEDIVELIPLWRKEFGEEIAGATDWDLRTWATREAGERTHALPYSGGQDLSIAPSLFHPTLKNMVEGNHFSYTYRERMVGALEHLAHDLIQNPDSRRAFWPIFQPLDALRAAELTRIPCSLGYQVMIREVPGQGRKLHLTYISRSCDFDKFWISDIWFANQFQRRLLQRLTKNWSDGPGPLPDLTLGGTSHFILSLHRFEEPGSEEF